MVYLDHNATTTILPEVKHFMFSLMDTPLNPSSIHANGRRGKNIIEKARIQIAGFTGIDKYLREYEITFTSSGTEANNLLISNFTDADIFISAIEHISILEQQKHLPHSRIIKVDSNGVIELEDLEYLLSQSTNPKKLVSVILANNETGVIQPVKKIVEIANKFGAFIHSDCVQALGKIPVDIKDLGLDFATISAHKFGGPAGSGALISKSKYFLKPMLVGGGQERGVRSGTENVAAIGGFGLAAEITKNNLDHYQKKFKMLQDKLETRLGVEFSEIEIIAKNIDRLPNSSLILIDGTDAQTTLIAFDMQNIAISSGSACSSGKVGKSHVLKAMGISDDKAQSAIRISTGRDQNEEDIDKFIEGLKNILGKNQVKEKYNG